MNTSALCKYVRGYSLILKDTLRDPDPKSRKAWARGLEQKYDGVADF